VVVAATADAELVRALAGVEGSLRFAELGRALIVIQARPGGLRHAARRGPAPTVGAAGAVLPDWAG
jgi:hypothetical protein